jgi:hypothetical protein
LMSAHASNWEGGGRSGHFIFVASKNATPLARAREAKKTTRNNVVNGGKTKAGSRARTRARRKTKLRCSLLPGKRRRGGPPNSRAAPFEKDVGTIFA